MIASLDDWGMMSIDNTIPEMLQLEEENNEAKKNPFFSLYSNSKNRIIAGIYNLYRNYPSGSCQFTESPIFMKGSRYNINSRNGLIDRESQVAIYKEDFRSILWLSYRRDFPRLSPSNITTDLGWGCMLRTGQMMLAQVLQILLLGKDWVANEENTFQLPYRKILMWFSDSPRRSCPYSIHNIVYHNKLIHGSLTQKDDVTNWFAPTVIAKVLKHLVRGHSPKNLLMYVPDDPVIYTEQVETLCRTLPSKWEAPPPVNGDLVDFWRPLFIMIPLRLGLDRLNPIYNHPLLALFQLPQSVGIIGGKPRQSLYFVAAQDEDLIYLDPHIVQPTIVMEDPAFSAQTFHCSTPQKINIKEIDPSLAIGFLCKNRVEFYEFCAYAQKHLESLFMIVYGNNPHYEDSEILEDSLDDYQYIPSDKDNPKDDDFFDEEDLVVL